MLLLRYHQSESKVIFCYFKFKVCENCHVQLYLLLWAQWGARVLPPSSGSFFRFPFLVFFFFNINNTQIFSLLNTPSSYVSVLWFVIDSFWVVHPSGAYWYLLNTEDVGNVSLFSSFFSFSFLSFCVCVKKRRGLLSIAQKALLLQLPSPFLPFFLPPQPRATVAARAAAAVRDPGQSGATANVPNPSSLIYPCRLFGASLYTHTHSPSFSSSSLYFKQRLKAINLNLEE